MLSSYSTKQVINILVNLCKRMDEYPCSYSFTSYRDSGILLKARCNYNSTCDSLLCIHFESNLKDYSCSIEVIDYQLLPDTIFIYIGYDSSLNFIVEQLVYMSKGNCLEEDVISMLENKIRVILALPKLSDEVEYELRK